ncbi:MAG: class I SAM-dependent methyltransferase [Candidatus Aminicenantia bacterium]
MKIYPGERDYPQDKKTNPRVQRQLAIYKFCSQFVKDKFVLDVGCGEGFGTYYLGQYAKKIIGIDNSKTSIETAKRNYHKENIEFIQMNARKIEFPDEYFETVISMGVIEHVKDYESYLKEMKRVLKKGGVCVFSFLKRIYKVPLEPYHFREFYLAEIKDLMEKHFSDNFEIFGLFNKTKSATSYRKTRFKLYDIVYYMGLIRLMKLLPMKVQIVIYETMRFILHNILWILKKKEIMSITDQDFEISKENLDDAINYIVVYRNV